jgi:hypothetical protein
VLMSRTGRSAWLRRAKLPVRVYALLRLPGDP